MNRHIYAIRGAVTVNNSDEEETAEMGEATGKLLDCILEKNKLKIENIISIQFTQTPDLTHKNAASALREARPEYGMIPLFCAQEPQVQGMFPKIIRVLVTCHGVGPGKPVYLGNTKKLRPDFIG